MKRTNTNLIWLSIAAVTSFLAVGFYYWYIPYGEINLPESLLTPGLIVVVFAALMLRLFTLISLLQVISVIGGSVGASVMARVLVEIAQDSTSHNLWPFEIVIALIVGFICALAGAAIGSLIGKFVPNHLVGKKS